MSDDNENESNELQIGLPSYGNERQERPKRLLEYRTLKEGDNVYRIFPPMHSLYKSGRGWRVFHKVHFGYSVVDAKDSSKVYKRPFECVEVKEYGSQEVKQVCAKCEQRKEKIALLEEQEVMCKTNSWSPERTEMHLAPLKKWLYEHNTDSKWYMLAIDRDDNYCLLRVTGMVKKLLEVKIGELVDQEQIDPIRTDQGVWFNLKRLARDGRSDTVEVVQTDEMINGRRMKSIKLAPLSHAQLKKGLEVFPDLSTCVTRITPDQVQALVESDGSPEAVQEVFSLGQRVKQMTSPVASTIQKANPVVVTKEEFEEAEGMTPEKFLESLNLPTR